MPRRRVDQWGLTFSIGVDVGGYEWTCDRDGVERLKPAQTPKRAVRHELGIQKSKDAYREFIGLGRSLESTEDPSTRKQHILQFANQYGLLKGSAESMSLEEWLYEASKLLDLDEVSRAIKRASFTDFRKRVRTKAYPLGYEVMVYKSFRLSQDWTIGRSNEYLELNTGRNVVSSNTLSAYEVAKNGNDRERAILVLRNAVNNMMSGGLSFNASMRHDTKFIVAPHRLIHLLYMRLWIDTVQIFNLEREVVCANPDCGNLIEGTARKKYCSTRCNWIVNNKKRAMARAAEKG